MKTLYLDILIGVLMGLGMVLGVLLISALVATKADISEPNIIEVKIYDCSEQNKTQLQQIK